MLNEEQKELRIGRFGGSDFKTLLPSLEYERKSGSKKGMDIFEMIDARFSVDSVNSIVVGKAFEKITGTRLTAMGLEHEREFSNEAINYGNENEAVAIAEFEKQYDKKVEIVGSFIGKEKNICLHVDGLVDDDAIIEVKCCSLSNFYFQQENGGYSKKHIPQIQVYMHFLKKVKCYFVCYNHLYKEKITVEEIEYSKEWGDQIEIFLDNANLRIEKILSKQKRD